MTAVALLLGGVMLALIFIAAYLEKIGTQLEKMTRLGAEAIENGATMRVHRRIRTNPPSHDMDQQNHTRYGTLAGTAQDWPE